MGTPEIFELESIKQKLNYSVSYTAAMPCLVDDQYLYQTINSLFKQEIKDIDVLYSIIIVISNCKNSNDLKNTILKNIENFFYKHDVSIKVFLFDKRLNGSEARNFCFKNTHSDFIGLCDSDDRWNADKVYKEMRLINSSKKNFNTQFIGSTTRKRFLKKTVFLIAIKVKHCLLFRKEFPHTSTWVLSKCLYSNISFENSLERFQDLAYILKARKICKKCLIINETLVDIRKSINRKKIKLQTLNYSLKFCSDYLDKNLIYTTLFVLKYFLYPRIRYFYLKK